MNYVIHPTFYQHEGEKIITVFSFFIELFLSAQRRQLFQANYINMNICFVTGTLVNLSLSVQIASGSRFTYPNWNFKKVGQISFLFLTVIRKYSIHVRHESRNPISSCFSCRMKGASNTSAPAWRKSVFHSAVGSQKERRRLNNDEWLLPSDCLMIYTLVKSKGPIISLK